MGESRPAAYRDREGERTTPTVALPGGTPESDIVIKIEIRIRS